MSLDAANRTQSGGNLPHVVIPYNYADHEFARKLAGALRRDGVSPWVDELDMSAGAILTTRMANAARPVDFLIPLISAASLRWRWVQQELKSVATREFNRRRIRVVSARIDGSKLPDYLATQPYVDFQGRGWRQAYEDIKAVVQQRPGPRPEPRTTQGFELPHAIRRAQPASEKAPRGKGTALDLQVMKSDLASVETTIAEADMSFGSEKYLEAQKQAKLAINTATTVKNELTAAMEAKMRR